MSRPVQAPAPARKSRAAREYWYDRPEHQVPAQATRLPSLDDYDRELCIGGWRS